MGRVLLSVVVGLAGVACVLALGFGLQSAVLPPPGHVDHVAADATRWLSTHPYSVDIFHSDGRRIRGACLKGWNPRPLKRDSLLLLHRGPLVLELQGQRHIRFVSGPRRRNFPADLAIRTGCSLQLGNALYTAAQGNTHISMERAYAAHRPAIALEMPNVQHERLTVYISPRQYRPLVAIASADRQTMTARIYLTRASYRLRLHYRKLLNRRTQRHLPPPRDRT